jgi:uncharacterized protein (TIGR03435 family)
MRLAALTALACTCTCVFAQAAGLAPLFDVASVKPSDPDEPGGRVQYLSGGRFAVENCQLNFILQRVYGVPEFQIADAPKWVSDWKYRFDIQATGDPAASDAQLHAMAQTLLAERFQLKVHRERREMPVYELAAKKGLTAGNNSVTLTTPPQAANFAAGDYVAIYESTNGMGQGRR